MADFSLERFFAKYEFQVKHLMCASDPESLSIGQLLALRPNAQQAFLDLKLGYIDSRGTQEFREQVTRLYESENVSIDNIVSFAGGEEPIFTVMNVLLSRGDHLIVHTPAYQSQFEVARAIGCEVSNLPAQEASQWHVDLNQLQSVVKSNTTMLVLNAPHNPTGAVLSIEEMNVCIAFARQHNLWIVCDEVYRGLELTAPKLPGICELYERGISIGAMAKTYGLAGLRVGWLACQDVELLHRCSAFKDYLTICNAAPSEFLATIALEHAEVLAARSRKQVVHNVTIFESFLKRQAHLFSWVAPAGSTMAFPRLLKGTADDFCARVVAESGVLLLPSTLFDFGNSHVRLGLGRANFEEAMRVFERWCETQ